MASTFMGLEAAKRSLFTHQTALQTTAHNMANANTAGYTRQTVNFVAAAPIEAPGLQRSTSPGQLGQSVEFSYIKRVRESFLDHQYYNENKSFGEWSIRQDSLEKLEAIINEPSDTGIRTVIENFWSAWQTLSKEPENATARAALKENSLALTEAFNYTGKQLNDLHADITANIEVKVTQVNTITEQIARLNYEIFRIEGFGNNANDLRDQRDLLADELSGIMNITVTESNAAYNISVGGINLVDGIEVGTVIDSASMESAFGSDLTSGEIYGMIMSRDQYVANYQDQLNSMVRTLAEGDVRITLPAGSVVPNGTVINGVTYSGSIENRTLAADTQHTVKGINGVFALGYTMETPPQSGLSFFTLKQGYTEFSADSITLNPNLITNLSQIAVSSRVYDDNGTVKVVKGNNDIALIMAGLRTDKFSFTSSTSSAPLLSEGTFDEFFRSIIGQLGVQANEANRQQQNQKILVDQVESRRQSISGVSLDEEMANMIQYQHAYNAAARAMTTFDEVLDKVINGMGLVGR
jgi:flagellar hook-associated protein 1 FlgK